MSWLERIELAQINAREPISVNNIFLGRKEPVEIVTEELRLLNQLIACYFDHLQIPVPELEKG